MPFIDHIHSVVRQFWTQSSMLTKTAMVGLTMALVAVGVYRYTWPSLAPHTALFSGRQFATQELTAMETALARAGLSDYEIRDSQMWVPPVNKSAYIGAIADAGALPLQFDLDLKQELSQSNPFESSEQWRARLQLAKQRELAKILCNMQLIDDASVQFDQQRSTGLRREAITCAMVVIRPAADAQVTSNLIRGIRHLVAASKASLLPANVTVTDLNTGISYAGNQELEPSLAQSDEYALRKSTYERAWTEKIISILTFIPGAEVATNVDLNVTSEPGSAGLFVPCQVRVSVGIPNSYYLDVARARTIGTTTTEQLTKHAFQVEAETKSKVKQLIQGLLPADANDCQAEVFVATFTDLDQPAQAVHPNQVLPRLRQFSSSAWLAMLCVLGIAAIVGLLARGIWQDFCEARTKQQPADDVTSPSRVEMPASMVADLQTYVEPQPTTHQETVDEELTRLVRNDPQSAAEMLGEWVRKAS